MTIEHARMDIVHKPWGSTELRPWSENSNDGMAIGEIWFQRPHTDAADPGLLLKLLFTREPLSIQVHPDDAFARSIGLDHGKTEAWYILSAVDDARIALGLKRCLSPAELRSAIDDGSIADLVHWRPVAKDDVVLIPAGTIHALGAGLVVAEIQQRSDTTFRLFDYGRHRELHVDNAVAAANAGPALGQSAPRRMTDARTLLVADPHFILERIDLAPRSAWELRADRETWLLVLDGHARIGLMNAFVGEAIFLDSERTHIKAGSLGLRGLLAYSAAAPCAGLLHNLDGLNACEPSSRLPQHPVPHQAVDGGASLSLELRT